MRRKSEKCNYFARRIGREPKHSLYRLPRKHQNDWLNQKKTTLLHKISTTTYSKHTFSTTPRNNVQIHINNLANNPTMFENALQPTKVRSRMQISIIRYEVHFVGHARCIFNPANDCELMHTHTIRRKMHFFVCVRVVEWKKRNRSRPRRVTTSKLIFNGMIVNYEIV